MKTTVDIADALMDEAKKRAALEGTTVKALIERGLREVLGPRKAERAFRLRKGSFKGKGLQRGVSGLGWDALRELAYEGRGG